MLTVQVLSAVDQDQLERKELARGAWREGNIESALLLIRSVLSEPMSPRVAAECYSVEAGCLADLGDFVGSLDSLQRMAEFLDSADVRIQGTFYNARGRAYRNLGRVDDALTDYSGALAYWQECGDRNYEGAVSINLAECYLRLEDLEQATQNIDHAFKVLPDGSEYWCNAYDTKAKVLLASGKAQQALSLIERAMELSGGNGLWEKTFLETKAAIKDRLLNMLAPLATMQDVERLKVQMIRHALDKAGGSITLAAAIIKTSHQVLAHAADSNGLARTRRKKSIIRHSPED